MPNIRSSNITWFAGFFISMGKKSSWVFRGPTFCCRPPIDLLSWRKVNVKFWRTNCWPWRPPGNLWDPGGDCCVVMIVICYQCWSCYGHLWYVLLLLLLVLLLLLFLSLPLLRYIYMLLCICIYAIVHMCRHFWCYCMRVSVIICF